MKKNQKIFSLSATATEALNQEHGQIRKQGENQGVHNETGHGGAALLVAVRQTNLCANHVSQLVGDGQRDDQEEQTGFHRIQNFFLLSGHI